MKYLLHCWNIVLKHKFYNNKI